jgi:hypothetical protein
MDVPLNESAPCMAFASIGDKDGHIIDSAQCMAVASIGFNRWPSY